MELNNLRRKTQQISTSMEKSLTMTRNIQLLKFNI